MAPGSSKALILILPLPLIQLMAGLALINVLLTSLQKAFHGRQFQMGAFFSLIISVSGITLFGISATFWALVGGLLISMLLEPKDFHFSAPFKRKPLAAADQSEMRKINVK